jgi:hypothetical protein
MKARVRAPTSMIAGIFLSLAMVAAAETLRPSVVMPASAAPQLRHLCSRSGPPPFESVWEPSAADVRDMEARLSDLAQLKSKQWIGGIQIEHPERHLRQYFGLVVGGRKVIYINASCGSGNPPLSWKEKVMDVCDGGACHWGVLYDPANGAFAELETNGVG